MTMSLPGLPFGVGAGSTNLFPWGERVFDESEVGDDSLLGAADGRGQLRARPERGPG